MTLDTMDGLLQALKRLRVETGGMACLGCGHEHNCGVHGCAIIRKAMEELSGMTRVDHPASTDKMVPLTLEQLREMDGKPVWVMEQPDWGHWELSEDADDYFSDRDTGLYGLTYPDPEGKGGVHKLGWIAYAYPPAHIDREAWEPCGACKNGEITIHVPEFRAMAVCNQHMDHEAFDLTLRLKFCPWCGRPLTLEAWDELEQRLRGEQVDERERDQS
ncbi:MAG: hypothetical protein KHZ05_10610 [Oscillospiraceae bacterium]|nr:hypothetical protein [Oscillospiraceae bacterium]